MVISSSTGGTGRSQAASILIGRRNYGDWSLPGWLLCRFVGIEPDEFLIPGDPGRGQPTADIPHLLVPSFSLDGVTLHDDLAIAEHLDAWHPGTLLPETHPRRDRCREVLELLHLGFAHLRSALPMELRRAPTHIALWSRASDDLAELVRLWRGCLVTAGGPFLFGSEPGAADALSAPYCLRLLACGHAHDALVASYAAAVVSLPAVQEWIQAARDEPEDLDPFEIEF